MSEKPKRRRRLLIIGGGLFLLCMCFVVAVTLTSDSVDDSTEVASVSDDTQAEPVEVEVTRIVEVEVEIPVTVEVEVTREVEVIVTVILATSTPSGPTATPTITKTPVPTNTPVPTEDVTKQSRGDGFYLIGSEMSPGNWRSTPGHDNCYWKVSNAIGDIMRNHFGDSGGVASIPASGFQFEADNCGQWEYLG